MFDVDREMVAWWDSIKALVCRVHGALTRFDHPLSGRDANGRPNRQAIIGATLIITAAVALADVDGAEGVATC